MIAIGIISLIGLICNILLWIFMSDKCSSMSKLDHIQFAIIFVALLSFSIFSCCNIRNQHRKNNEASFILDIPEFYNKDAREGLKDALVYYDIKDPEIVYAMARLETGNFNSRLCIEDNNLLGLYDSRNKRFFKFEHWTDCIVAYKNMIEYKRLEDEDMYHFLKRITYAEDPEYINKLKTLTKTTK